MVIVIVSLVDGGEKNEKRIKRKMENDDWREMRQNAPYQITTEDMKM